MIYLIDDTPLQMLEGYMNPDEFADVLVRIEYFPEEDIPSLAGADCVLIHDSYHDSIVKRKIQTVVDNGNVAPLVLFSDGDSPVATFNGDNFIIAIKKKVLYSRLSKFLRYFRKNNLINLAILAGEQAVSPKRQSVPLGTNNVFSDFFAKMSIDFTREPVARSSGPNIYCLGRDGMDIIARSIGGIFVKVAFPSLNNTKTSIQDQRIHDFLVTTIKDEIGVLLLDTDADPTVCMLLALHFRMTESLPGHSKFAPIVFVSDLSLEKLIKKDPIGSQIFMTEGVYLCKRADVASQKDSFQALDRDSFRECFLDRIIIPSPKGSNHSLANQWGASRMYMIIKGNEAKPDTFKEFQDIHKRLYFKYIFHRIPSSSYSTETRQEGYRVRGSVGKRILLIDDEASKGWVKTISLLFPFSHFDPVEDVISESVSDYDSLPASAKSRIESNDYDLILLDLRLGGILEDSVVKPEEMSGYKVLTEIKTHNRGTQVIILTASDKAWNLKAIMRPGLGADGYFVKESPEYEFSDQISAANLQSLVADAERCLQRGYLRSFWSFIRSFDTIENSLMAEVRSQLDIAYEMVSQADTPEKFRHAYLSLYQVFECITSNLTGSEPSVRDLNEKKLLTLPGNKLCQEIIYPSREEVLFSQKPYALHQVGKREFFSQRDKIIGLYLQSWGQEDHGLLFLIWQLIDIRNTIVHPNDWKGFDYSAQIREKDIQQGMIFFNDSKYVFSSSDLKPLFEEASATKLLYSDSNGRPILHKDIANSSLGIRFLLFCLNELKPFLAS